MKNNFNYLRTPKPATNTRTRIAVFTVFIAGASALLYGVGRMSEANTRHYENLRIAGVVQQIIGFNRGFPILSINGQETYISHLPPDFGKYILPGDSVYKASGEFTVTSYRINKNCTEIKTWQYGLINGYEQPDIRTRNQCRYLYH